MIKYLGTLGRVLLAQLFLLQVIALIIGFFNNPTGYLAVSYTHLTLPTNREV